MFFTKPSGFHCLASTLVAIHPHVPSLYTRCTPPSSPRCKGWQHGGVREIMCLFLPKKEIAFVE
ncbi:hypothetical protein DW784_14485 [Parabacteroides merdae]|nr:hypothetical protein DW784_14485 [Parabacteroides merdae]